MTDPHEHVEAKDVPALPLVGGRRPRVVGLVYNDASTDSRVQKTSATLRAEGADVHIVASERRLAGHPAGTGTVGDDLVVHRVPDLDLTRMLPRVTRAWRAVRGRRGAATPGTERAQREQARAPGTPSAKPAPTRTPRTEASPTQTLRTEAPPSQTPRTEAPPTHAPPTQAPPTLGRTAYLALRGDRAAARSLAADVWMRTYQTARLGTWWLGAVRQTRALAPDVVHANDANALVPALLSTLGTQARVVYDSHELWRHRNIRQDRVLAPLVEAVIESLGVRLAAGVITVSPSIVDWLQRHYRLAEAPTLVRNIPTARPTPPREDGRLRELSGLGPEARIVSYTGGITTGRGLEETVDALALLGPQVHLVLLGYGDPRYVAGLRARAERAGVSDRVHLVGSVPSAQVPQTLADADVAVVFVRPICLSYRFSLPNKLFESIHAGLPIVAADLPDTAEVVRRHGVGEVFDAQTPTDLAGAIDQVLAAPGRYREAAARAAQELTWEDEAARLVGLYTRVLQGPARG